MGLCKLCMRIVLMNDARCLCLINSFIRSFGFLSCFVLLFHFNVSFFVVFLLFSFDSVGLFIFMFLLFFIIFCSKYPLWPFHSWSPEVHVEVSTEFSCILAAIILKCGFFGLFRYLFICFYIYAVWFVGFMDGFVFCGLLYCSLFFIFVCRL